MKKITYRSKSFIWTLIAMLVLLPALMYLYKFGVKPLSNDQSVWGDFGSYFSGVYTVIFSLFTVLLLRKQNKTQDMLIEHNVAMKICADANLHLQTLDVQLREDTKEKSKFETLRNTFAGKSLDELKSANLVNVAQDMHKINEKIRGAWIGFNVALKSLKEYQGTSFDHYYTSTKLLPESIFGHACCVALDNYAFILTQGTLVYREYSDILKS